MDRAKLWPDHSIPERLLGRADDVARRARVPLRRVGGLDLVDLCNAEASLDACLAANESILGAEGFIVTEKGVMPAMDAIVDLSGGTDSVDFERFIRTFVETVEEPKMLFESVLHEES